MVKFVVALLAAASAVSAMNAVRPDETAPTNVGPFVPAPVVVEKRCVSDTECGADSFCSKTSCGAQASGFCRVKPEGCTADYRPVCGCDGKTYSNACGARTAGASVDHEGECKAACRNNTGCGAGEFCKRATGVCLDATAEGTCETRPQVCTADYRPVCGCDGKTYSNACGARTAGASVDHEGECKLENTAPTCVSDYDCAAAEFCSKPFDTCDEVVVVGSCLARPAACTREYRPVCGCDGTTYSNRCAATTAGMNVASNTTCESSRVITGTAGADRVSFSDCGTSDLVNITTVAGDDLINFGGRVGPSHANCELHVNGGVGSDALVVDFRDDSRRSNVHFLSPNTLVITLSQDRPTGLSVSSITTVVFKGIERLQIMLGTGEVRMLQQAMPAVEELTYSSNSIPLPRMSLTEPSSLQ